MGQGATTLPVRGIAKSCLILNFSEKICSQESTSKVLGNNLSTTNGLQNYNKWWNIEKMGIEVRE